MNTVSDDLLTAQIDSALCRSRVYALLAFGFGYPDEDIFNDYSDGGYAAEISQEIAVCCPELAEYFVDEISSRLKPICTFDVFESQFLSAFETNMPSPSASLNEGVHLFKSDRPGLLLELKGFYNNFGLQVSGDGNELDDTLTAELEFMQFLTMKQAYAQIEGVSHTAYMLAQRDFLARHLCAWLPLLLAELSEKVTTPFFIALAEFANKFAQAHLQKINDELVT
jgi:DMSO reductase family type II enzyme chaperone